MSTLWHGRFEGGPADELMAFTVSLPFDQRLAPDDIEGSRAHVRGLVRGAILSDEEGAAVLAALDAVEGELRDGSFAFGPSDEDIHTAVERRVTELAGAAGAKIHTGRSRNDQVATDLRLYCKREVIVVARRILELQQVLGVHLSRLAEEIILWSTDEFGFLELADAYSTGSSMLPQKKNPDIAELTRGKSGRLIGNLTGLLATLKGLPLAYNRDLQEDKEPLFDSLDQTNLALAAMTGLLASSTFVLEAMQAAADAPTSAATDLAEYLVAQGLPFRDAHAIVGALVRESLEGGASLADLVEDHGDLGKPALHLLQPGVAVTRRTTPGGAGPEPAGAQLARLTAKLESDWARVGHAAGQGPGDADGGGERAG